MLGLAALPGFWIAMFVIAGGAWKFEYAPPLTYVSPLDSLAGNLLIMAPPALILGVGLSGEVMRLTRASLPASVGPSPARVVDTPSAHESAADGWDGFLRASIAIAQGLTSQLPVAIGGTVILEQLFGIPGMGRYLIAGVSRRDLLTVQAALLATAAVVLLLTFAVDLVCFAVRPRDSGPRRLGKRAARDLKASPMQVATVGAEINGIARKSTGRGLRPPRLGMWLITCTRRNPLIAGSAVVVLLVLCCAVFAPLLVPYGFDVPDRGGVLAGPSLTHLLGTDEMGRDVLSRVVYASRASIFVALCATLLAQSIGAVTGVTAAVSNGRGAWLLQRFTDICLPFPAILFVIALAAVFPTPATPRTYFAGPFATTLDPAAMRTAQVGIELGFILWPGAALVVCHALIESRRRVHDQERQRASMPPLRALRRSAVPSILPDMLVSATIQFAAAVLILASLSFLGFGIPRTIPNWGSMLAGNTTLLPTRAPLVALGPGLAIAITVFALSALADVLEQRRIDGRKAPPLW
jgi:peptide/nickel transport system permease protein